ncbi:E3 ubiquitin-protein ligase UBR3-like [Dioscorea cayenensis subsp. rotundata]|uniref:E3 ubiquitin-protein ligase n=1 Tax=Dioscorea cayennensis subsp. rotundata TaxID=55577 RepID=A0AB40BPC7_DIOCR|nr:E3 ubiquitin-protein ligase UBR3-like [Dioscorea cayenensis subsp. rotundata]
MDNASVIENSYLAIELTSPREIQRICSKFAHWRVILQDEFVHTLATKQCVSNIFVGSSNYVKLQCCHCKSIPDEPALCLLCGKLCSPSWKYCCRENSCLEHAMTCGAGVGVFLLVRKTTILLLGSVRLAARHLHVGCPMERVTTISSVIL